MRLFANILYVLSITACAGCTTGGAPKTGPAPDRPDMHTDFPFMGHHEQATGNQREGVAPRPTRKEHHEI